MSGYLRNLRGRLLSSEKFSEVFALWFFTLKPFPGDVSETPVIFNARFFQKPPNVGAGACGIWGHGEEAQRPLHETMRLAEARLERHAPGGSMPFKAPKHCKIQSRRDESKMATLEAPCGQNAPGRNTMRPPEALLPRNPTWESPHFSGLRSFFRRSAVKGSRIHLSNSTRLKGNSRESLRAWPPKKVESNRRPQLSGHFRGVTLLPTRGFSEVSLESNCPATKQHLRI